MFKVVKCWDVGYTIQNTKTKKYLGWLGVFDRNKRDLENEMIQLFDSRTQAQNHIDNYILRYKNHYDNQA